MHHVFSNEILSFKVKLHVVQGATKACVDVYTKGREKWCAVAFHGQTLVLAKKNHKIRKCTLKSAFTIFAKLTHDGRCWKTRFLPSILWIAVPTVLLCFQWAFVALATLPCDWAMHRFPGIWPQNAGYPPSTPPIDFCANGPYCWCLPNVLVIGWLKDPRLGLVSPRPNLGGL